MKSIDARQKHAVALTFLLHEDISPQELAQKIASACGGSVLQPGDGILVEHAKIACVVTDETLSLPSFGWQWRTSMKEPKRKKLTRNRCSRADLRRGADALTLPAIERLPKRARKTRRG